MVLTEGKQNTPERAPAFELEDVRTGARVSLAAAAGAVATVVVFTCAHCPYAVLVERALADFAREYRARGVHVVLVNPNVAHPGDSSAGGGA